MVVGGGEEDDGVSDKGGENYEYQPGGPGVAFGGVLDSQVCVGAVRVEHSGGSKSAVILYSCGIAVQLQIYSDTVFWRRTKY